MFQIYFIFSGTFSQTVVALQPGKFTGFMLWGSYLNGATEDLGAFPTPVLHVSGDLDGLTRMTRIGKAFRYVIIHIYCLLAGIPHYARAPLDE